MHYIDIYKVWLILMASKHDSSTSVARNAQGAVPWAENVPLFQARVRLQVLRSGISRTEHIAGLQGTIHSEPLGESVS